jgi:glycine dehydrogenase
MIQIHAEITAVANGETDAGDNVLKNAPHTAATLLANEWEHPYSREDAAYPLDWVRESKYWPPVGRIDNVFGDRNLVCTCEGMEAYQTGAGSAD